MNENPITLDVREDIRAGREPFSKIMEAVARLEAGVNLLVIAPFEPAPLFSVLAQRGFRHDSRQTPTGDWQVLFSRDTQNFSEPCSRRREEALTGGETAGAKGSSSHLTSAAAETLVVDARGLEPPQPMVRILETLDALPTGAELRARTDRRPIHLYPLLEERGFIGASEEQSDGSFITIIRHA